MSEVKKYDLPDGFEIVGNIRDESLEPKQADVSDANTILNVDASGPKSSYYRDRSKGSYKGHPVMNNNKTYNDLTPEQLQMYLSDVYDQRIYTDNEGVKYQLTGLDGRRQYLKDQDLPTSYLYGGTAKTDPNVLKFGVGRHGVKARYAPKSEWKRYGKNKTKTKGYPSGEQGIDADTAFMDWELPRDIATSAEKIIHGNYGNIDSRLMFKDETLRDLQMSKALGSGKSEYYDGRDMPLMNAPDKEESFTSYPEPEEVVPEIPEVHTYVQDDWQQDFEIVGNVNDSSFMDKAGELLFGALPMPVRQMAEGVGDLIDTGTDIVDSAVKVYDQGKEHGVMPTLRDAGRGLTAGMYDSADFITSVGGLLPNDFSRGADTIANKIRADREIPESEIERIAEHISEGAVGGVIGGKIGDKVFDSLGLNLSPKAQALRGKELQKTATTAAANAEKTAKLNGASDLEASMAKLNAYENMTKVPEPQSYVKAFFGDDSSLVRKVDTSHTNGLNFTERLKKIYRDTTLGEPRKIPDSEFKDVHTDPGINALIKDATDKARNPFYGLGDGFQPKTKKKPYKMDEPLPDGYPSNGLSADDLILPERNMGNPTVTRLASAFAHNLDRKYGPRANLQKNEEDFLDRYNRNPRRTPNETEALQNGLMHYLSDKSPTYGRDYGAVIGMLMGGSSNEHSAENPY